METLITFVGKNKLTQGSKEYAKVQYRINGKPIEESFFGNAILKSENWHFDKMIVIGTETSDWGVLIDSDNMELDDQNPAYCLWEELFENAHNNQSISTNQLQRLEEIVKIQWKIKDVVLVCHAAVFEGNEGNIYQQYFQAVKDLSGNIVLDVTHSFRWMPMLMQSVLNVANSLESGQVSVSTVYGDVSQNNHASGLSLEEYHRIDAHAKAVSLFFDKWDAEPLVELLKNANMKSIAKPLNKLANHLGGNFIVPLVADAFDPKNVTPFKSLLNAINTHEQARDEFWIRAVLEKLKDFCQQFVGKTASEQLWLLADMYAARKMYAQALICQETCLSIFAWEQAGAQKEDLDYEKLKEIRRDFCWKKGKKLADSLNLIVSHRNTVAHGTASMEEFKQIEHVNNLPEIFKSQQKLLEDVLEWN